jgi:HPt (histidine-containing phosphotransfer) domain-containing protein
MIKSRARQRREFDRLRGVFLVQLPIRVRAIETALNEVLSAVEIDQRRVEAVFHLAHRLCGSAGIYGCANVHAIAGALECAAQEFWQTPGKDEPRGLAELRQLVEALKQSSEEAVAPADSK